MSCNELDLVKIGDICDVGSSKRIYASDYTESGIPFYRSKEVIELATNQEIINELFISKDKFNQLDEKFGSPKNGDILLASIGANMGIPYYVNTNYKFYFKDGNVTWFKNFKNNVNSKYIYYWIKSPLTQQKFINIAIGSAQKALTIDSLKKLDIYLPPLEEQEKIANILSSLDDKIELNNEMNKTLEEMAQSIFKRWFVDFEFPNADGKPYKSSGGEMVESDLGMIPKGWEVGTLKDLLDNIKVSVKAGKDLKGMPYLPIDTIPMKKLGINTYKSWEEAKSSLIKFNKNDILLGAMRVYFHRVVVVPFEGITRSTCFVLRPKNSVDHSFLTLKLFEEDTISYANSMSKGTTMPYAVWENGLADMPTVIPNTVIRKIFDERIKNIIEAISTSCFEQYKLVELRDTLLPKLMSGEIDV